MAINCPPNATASWPRQCELLRRMNECNHLGMQDYERALSAVNVLKNHHLAEISCSERVS